MNAFDNICHQGLDSERGPSHTGRKLVRPEKSDGTEKERYVNRCDADAREPAP